MTDLIRISQAQLKTSISRLEVPLGKYIWIQKRFIQTLDSQNDSDFRPKINEFYGVRWRKPKWLDSFYGLMGELRGKSTDFKYVLNEIYKRTGYVEASFASKLIATLDPTCPVIDSVVLKNLKTTTSQVWSTESH